VHQHLLERADLKAVDRHRAQHALADDFMKAGLFDRAEAAYKALEGTAFDGEARLARLSLHERARDWRAATEVATELERRGSGSFATRIAHYACEMALQADAAGQTSQAEQELQRARTLAPWALRPMLLTGQRLARAGDPAAALQQWDQMLAQQPEAWPLVAVDYARSALACADCSAAFERLHAAYEAEPDIDLLQARIELEGTSGQHDRLVLDHLQRQPTLGAAAKVLELPVVQWDEATPQQLRQVVAAAARPLQRYRCAACGFEAHHYFWQCPGCQGWDTYPPRRMEAL
jgi:lipopolysaccharide biosynthesis regulator YciM